MSSFRRRLVALIVLLLGSLAVLTAPAHAATGSEDSKVAWTVRTALSKYGSGRPKFTYTVKPGEQLTDGIDVNNTGPHRIALEVYAADGFTTGSGGFDVLTPEKRSREVGAWVKPAVARVVVPAGKQVQIPFTMTVPADATPGDHVGGIVTVLDQRDPSGSGTVIHRRVGLRIEARVSGEVRSRLAVEDVKLGYSGHNPFGTGRAVVSYTVHNTGNTVLGGLQKVKVAGGLGLSAKTVDLDRLPELLPGETWHARKVLDGVRAMLWVSAHVTVTPAATDAAGSTRTLAPVTASSRTVVSAWSFVILGAFLVALAALIRLVVLGTRRWRRSSSEKVEAEVEAKVAAALEEALLKEKHKEEVGG